MLPTLKLHARLWTLLCSGRNLATFSTMPLPSRLLPCLLMSCLTAPLVSAQDSSGDTTTTVRVLASRDATIYSEEALDSVARGNGGGRPVTSLASLSSLLYLFVRLRLVTSARKSLPDFERAKPRD